MEKMTQAICAAFVRTCALLLCVWAQMAFMHICVHACLTHACVFVWKRTFMNVYVGSGCWSSLYTGPYKVQVFSVRPWFLSPYPKGFKRLTFLLDLSLCTVALGRLCTNLTYCSHQLTDYVYCSFTVLFSRTSFHRIAEMYFFISQGWLQLS